MIKLKDCEILDINMDEENYGGCPTCNYGSSYINEIEFWDGKRVIRFEVSQMYEYLMSVGDVLKIILNNIDVIAELNWEEFGNWFENEIKECEEVYDISVEREEYDCNEYEWDDITRKM